MIGVVTGFVPILDHPRSEAEYRKLGQRLMTAQVPSGEALLMQMEMKLEDCWLYQYLKWRGRDCTHSISDNPKKNSVAYHIVQAQKSELLMEAARAHAPADVLVWLDFGIYHLKGMNDEVLIDFLRRAQHEQAIAIPGCWRRGERAYDEAHPYWRFCGGAIICPRQHVIMFDAAMKLQYRRHIERTNNLVWEVSILAELEEEQPDIPIWWYGPCDHDVSMLTNYRKSEVA